MKGDWRREPRGSWFPLLLNRIVIAVLLFLPVGLIVMLLWNFTLPGVVSGIGPISFWQSLALLLLSRILLSPVPSPERTNTTLPTKPQKKLHDEDRAAFLARIRQRLSEQESNNSSNFAP